MKKFSLLLTAGLVVAGFSACNSSEKDLAKKDAADLIWYVDSVDQLKPVYTISYWSRLDSGYQARALKSEQTVSSLETADKEKLAESKAAYASLKANYEAKFKEQEAEALRIASTPDYRQILRNRLFGEGRIGADMKFGFVTADNILSVYQNFVDVVAKNKNNYSREDWDEIKVLYEALDSRKNSVEKDLSSRDNLKIAGLKIKFVTIKATKRGGTKVAENEAAKG